MLAAPAQVPPPPSSRRRRWVIAGVTAWAVLLAGAAFWSARRDEPTVREQRSIEQAMPVVQRAVGVLAAAAGPDGVLEIGPERLTTGCRLTTARDGATYERDVRIFTTPAEGPARLDDVAGRLPEAYRARVRHGTDGDDHTLRADAGEFVGMRGGVTQPGVITLTVATGCRPLEGGVAADTLRPPAELMAVAAPVAAVLGAGDDVDWTAARCFEDDRAVTVRVTSRPGTVPGPLPAALRDRLAGATVVLETPELVAYRLPDGVGVVVEAGGGRVSVAATKPCRAQ